jgi:hypothetical protein
MNDESLKSRLFQLRDDLQEMQKKGANRERSIVLTHIETDLPWMHKPDVDALDSVSVSESTQG